MFKIKALTLLMVEIVCVISQHCSPRSYNIITRDGPSLPRNEIISSHTVNSGVVVTECYEFCKKEPKCVGFNYRNTKNVVNCQLTNITGKIDRTATKGEWILMEDVEAAKNEEKRKSESISSASSSLVQSSPIATPIPVSKGLPQSVPSTLAASKSSFVEITSTPLFKSLSTSEPSTTSYYPSSTQTTSPNNSATNCAHLYNLGFRKDGVYTIDPDGLGSFNVSCDMNTDRGGWTVFQRRQDGRQDFFLGWSNYTVGFGNLSGEFWLGLDKVYRLIKSVQNVLRVDLKDFNDTERYAKYETFSVANKSDKYRLTIGDYSGDADDSLAFHNQMQFTTKDSDNDANDGVNCATRWKGAWWYEDCYRSNLNGLYLDAGPRDAEGIVWDYWHYHSLKKTEMKIRPKQF